MMVAGYSGRLLYAGISCDGLKQVSNLTDTPTLAICQSPEKYLDENKHRFMFFFCFRNWSGNYELCQCEEGSE